MISAAGPLVRLVAVVAAVTIAMMSQAAAIVGGAPVSPRAYPFMVALIDSHVKPGQERGYAFCGGTLVAERWVLTAAQCVYWRNRLQAPNEIEVYAGSDDLTGGDRIKAVEFVVHPQFDLVRRDNDIALLRLERPPRPELKTGTVKLTPDSVPWEWPQSAPVTVVGWGRATAYPSKTMLPSPGLQALDLQLQMSAKCDMIHFAAKWRLIARTLKELRLSPEASNEFAKLIEQDKPSAMPPRSLCASRDTLPWTLVFDTPHVALPPQPAPCRGDEGGPLLTRDADGSLMEIGIVSFAITTDTGDEVCGSMETPVAYTNVGVYEPWVRSIVSGH